MKSVGCDPHIEASKAAILKWHPSGHTRAKIDKCHDATEEDGASSNTPYKVDIEEKTRHKQDRDNL